jgi:hypothetical protein
MNLPVGAIRLPAMLLGTANVGLLHGFHRLRFLRLCAMLRCPRCIAHLASCPVQAELLVADAGTTLTVSGNGDVLEPSDGVMGIGSGSPYAVAAAR